MQYAQVIGRRRRPLEGDKSHPCLRSIFIFKCMIPDQNWKRDVADKFQCISNKLCIKWLDLDSGLFGVWLHNSKEKSHLNQFGKDVKLFSSCVVSGDENLPEDDDKIQCTGKKICTTENGWCFEDFSRSFLNRCRSTSTIIMWNSKYENNWNGWVSERRGWRDSCRLACFSYFFAVHFIRDSFQVALFCWLNFFSIVLSLTLSPSRFLSLLQMSSVVNEEALEDGEIKNHLNVDFQKPQLKCAKHNDYSCKKKIQTTNSDEPDNVKLCDVERNEEC